MDRIICPYITGSKNTAPGWGVNQQQMGALVGTSRQTISQIERGDYSPSVTLALKLARACGVRVEDIFQYEEERTDETE